MLKILLFVPLIALSEASHAAWSLLARDDGCIGLERLTRREGLPRTPSSPEDFAQQLRTRGESVSMGLPAGFPPELTGRIVQVDYGPQRSVIFASDDACRNLGGSR